MDNQIYIVRHGESVNNVLGIESTDIQNKDKFGLSSKGKEDILNQSKKYVDFEYIYTSPFRRAKETAHFFGESSNCKVIEEGLLREVYIGDLEECSSEELHNFFQSQLSSNEKRFDEKRC